MDERLIGSPNIVLTGFMATGKTTVGRLLADRTGRTFLDTDEVIEARYGPIPRIFATQGESAFRALESTVARDLSHREGLVIATGGGMLLDPANAAALSATGRVICLVADPLEILARVESQEVERPLLQGPDRLTRITELLAERRERYDAFEQVGTSGRTLGQIVDEILA